MLRIRILTAALLLPLVLALFILGPAWLLQLFLLIFLTLSLYEIANILFPAFERALAPPASQSRRQSPIGVSSFSRQKFILSMIAIVLGWTMFLPTANSTGPAGAGFIAMGLMGALMIGALYFKPIPLAMARSCALILSLIYGALPWVVVWRLYEMGPGARYPLLVMTVTWMGDTGGYFGGRFLGGKLSGSRKLAPAISPKKTWEGAMAGLLMSVLGALALNGIYQGSLGSSTLVAVVALVGGLFGQLGDLVESVFKRFAGVKDSGVIFPGHGGFLDRVDGILFAAPAIWFMLYVFRP